MLIVLGIYAVLIWLLFFQLKVLPWNRASQVVVALVGLVIVLVVIGLLNTKTPSGRVTVVAKVTEIAPVVGGVVKNIPVQANQPLKEGDVLLELDPDPFQYAVNEAEANLRIAEITLNRIETVLDRGSQAVSEQRRDEAKATFKAAEAAFQQAQYNLDQTVVKAPSAGVVTALGATVGDQARPLNPVLPFIKNGSETLIGVFRQNGLAAMPVGTPVNIAFDVAPGRIFESEVVEIVPGTSSGQLPVGSNLLGAADIGSSGEILIILAWPADLDRSLAIAGSVGTATAFGPDAGAMGILATVLLFLKMLGTYL
ncbi:efflux RND transporter periplasmic adaptor subunit [Labrenzia sp. PHM005]|uniref:efflux RND transporter periplasmic adaptor subunit n=1 Tax=Labrenzia sp. PHM005 TaxID=2590016 RepID=UPI0011407CF9|nr:biotin/lipoyl-binding protein [Labrenzia sp. PHM005]QDG77608.1 biotin/lipoyl-binding protein [Labrenzia sp. PHM005]